MGKKRLIVEKLKAIPLNDRKTNNTLNYLNLSYNQLSYNMKSQLEAIQQYKRDGSNGYQQVEGMWIGVY